MALDWLRLVLAGFWLAVGVAVFFRTDLAPGGLADRIAGANGDLVALLAVGLAVWNLVRWFLGRVPKPAAALPVLNRPVRERPDEYNPELDFTRPRPPEGEGG